MSPGGDESRRSGSARGTRHVVRNPVKERKLQRARGYTLAIRAGASRSHSSGRRRRARRRRGGTAASATSPSRSAGPRPSRRRRGCAPAGRGASTRPRRRATARTPCSARSGRRRRPAGRAAARCSLQQQRRGPARWRPRARSRARPSARRRLVASSRRPTGRSRTASLHLKQVRAPTVLVKRRRRRLAARGTCRTSSARGHVLLNKPSPGSRCCAPRPRAPRPAPTALIH
mmetsp:Transcript_17258/g.45375  ORF Transcript_17258/g.45375 Transcript_17258/m.45375 type:complete len:231 (-) Transcript_17258:633-1325(-)